MAECVFTRRVHRRRRALVAIQVMVLLTVLIGFAALTVDIGQLYTAKAELQRAADSAALSAVSALTTDDMMKVRVDPGDTYSSATVSFWINDRASHESYLNETLGSPTLIDPGHITAGWLNLNSTTAEVNPAVAFQTTNAVQVSVNRGEGINGPVMFFFAPIFGIVSGDTGATATAAFDDRMIGFEVMPGGAGMMPFTVHETVFFADLAGGGDDFEFDPAADLVTSGSDGVREINLYPHDVGPGNFGLLNVNNPSAGVPAHREDIDEGISPEDFVAEVGTSELTFYDGLGNPTTYFLPGNPGMETSLRTNVADRIGDVVAFFLHDQATGTGDNLVYRITQVRFGRVMGVQLTGPDDQQGFWVQPVTYVGSDVRIDPTAPSSGGVAGRLVLVR